MDRRNFLRSMLGVAAATALPSEVWPFKKIFLPMAPRITRVDMLDLSQWGRIQGIELESFAKEIPDLFLNESLLYKYFKNGPTIIGSNPPTFRVPRIIVENTMRDFNANLDAVINELA